MKTSAPTRTVRVTVPLFGTWFLGVEGRLNLTDKIVLAQLEYQEVQRIQESHFFTAGAPQYRLEIHDVIVPDDPNAARVVVAPMVKRCLALLSCAIRVAPRWEYIALDEQREVWTRW
jgi:hypothetical protein